MSDNYILMCNEVKQINVSLVFYCRVLTELVSKMKDMQMDKTELGCLRAIVLFNPGQCRLVSVHLLLSRGGWRILGK